MVAKEQQVGASYAPGDGEDQGKASKDSAVKKPAMPNNGKNSPAPCKQTGSSPKKKSKASAAISESDKKSRKKSASTDEVEEESDDDLAPVHTGQTQSKSAAPAAYADANKKTPSKIATPSSSAAKHKSSTKKPIPSSKNAIPSTSKVGSASTSETSKKEKDQKKQDGDDVLMTEKNPIKKRQAPVATSVRIVAAAESVRIVAAHPTFQNGPIAGGGIRRPSRRPGAPLS